MFTTPSMGLIVWNQPTDPYESTQLAGNWAKVDEHDHTAGKGLPITTAAIADGAITSPKLSSTLTVPNGSVGTTQLANGSVTLPILDAAVKADWEYSYSTYKTIIWREGGRTADMPGATYVLNNSTNILGVGTSLYLNAGFYLDPADWAAGSRTIKLRLRGQIVVPSTAPTTTLTFGLYPITATNSSGNIPTIDSVGSVVSGSTAAFVTPAATSQNHGVSADFTAPSAGFYALCVVNSGASAANSWPAFRAELQMRQV